MIVIKALSLFHGNPQTSDLKPDFWNCFKKKHFPCTSNTQLKGSEKEKAKKVQWKKHKNYNVPTMTEQLTIAQKQKEKWKSYATLPLSPHPNPNINEPPLTLPSLHHVVTTQLSWYPWHKWGNLIDIESQAMMIYWVFTWDLVEALQSASLPPARHQPHPLTPSTQTIIKEEKTSSAKRGTSRTKALVSLYWWSRILPLKQPINRISWTLVGPVKLSWTWKKIK